jgi:hypothetical protein
MFFQKTKLKKKKKKKKNNPGSQVWRIVNSPHRPPKIIIIIYIYGILGTKKIIAFVIQKFPNSAKFHPKKVRGDSGQHSKKFTY